MSACFICQTFDERVLILEKHHYLGKKYSDLTIWLCLNCHKKITDSQNKLPVKVRKSYYRRNKDIFALCSIGALYKELGQELINISFRLTKVRGAKK